MKDEKNKTSDKEETPMTHYYNQNEMYADMFGDNNKEHSTVAYILMGAIPVILFALFFILLAIKG